MLNAESLEMFTKRLITLTTLTGLAVGFLWPVINSQRFQSVKTPTSEVTSITSPSPKQVLNTASSSPTEVPNTTSSTSTETLVAHVPSSVLDDWADIFFYEIRPEMIGRQIESDQTLYRKEWLAIRQVIPDMIAWTEIQCGAAAESGQYEYTVVNYDADAIADAVFYARHPELKGRKIRPGETDLANEWSAIRRNLVFDFC